MPTPPVYLFAFDQQTVTALSTNFRH